jgi:DNA repair exonuclease SbcCD ATPase subunit
VKIKTLNIENFRSHKDTKLTFGRINLIRGANNSGKSSIAMAIEWLLTGRCSVTNEAGAGSEQLIRIASDSKTAAISAEIEVNKGLQVSVARRRTARGGDSLGKLDIHPDVISAALRAGRFLELKPNDQNELLADMLKPEPVKVPSEIREAIKQAGLADHESMSLDELRAFEGVSIKLRAECTAILRELGEPVEPKELKPDQPSLKGCKDRLDKLRAEQNGLTRDKASLQNAWAERSRQAREALATIPKVKASILDTKTEEELLAAIENHGNSSTAVSELSRLNYQITQIQGAIANLEQTGGKCPTCGQPTEIDDVLKRYQDQLADAKSRMPGLELAASRFMPLQQAEERMRKHREAVTDLARYTKILADSPADEPAPDTKAIDDKIADIERRMKIGQETVATLAADAEIRRHYAETVEARQRVERKREFADQVAKWTGPNGAQASAGRDKMGAFITELNEILHKLGYDVQFPGIGHSILIGQWPIGRQLSTSRLSESEAWRFSVAFQMALAKISGLNFVVLDRADMLVGKNKGLLMKALLESDLDQVFIMASTGEPGAFHPDITTFDLELDKEGITRVSIVQ